MLCGQTKIELIWYLVTALLKASSRLRGKTLRGAVVSSGNTSVESCCA